MRTWNPVQNCESWEACKHTHTTTTTLVTVCLWGSIHWGITTSAFVILNTIKYTKSLNLVESNCINARPVLSGRKRNQSTRDISCMLIAMLAHVHKCIVVIKRKRSSHRCMCTNAGSYSWLAYYDLCLMLKFANFAKIATCVCAHAAT